MSEERIVRASDTPLAPILTGTSLAESLGVVVERDATASARSTRDVLDLYPDTGDEAPLRKAMKLLEEGLSLIQEARSAFMEEDRIGADDRIQRLRSLLPELFCYSFGDGYKGTILAIYSSLVNLEGEAIDQDQVIVIKEALEQVKLAPFLDFSEILATHDRFESAGLKPDPKELDNFVAIFDEPESSDTSD
jgi:hypothetical protein